VLPGGDLLERAAARLDAEGERDDHPDETCPGNAEQQRGRADVAEEDREQEDPECRPELRRRGREPVAGGSDLGGNTSAGNAQVVAFGPRS
jgi:hypothetical protein